MHLRLAALILALSAATASAQVTPDQAARMVLDSARRAYNEKNYPGAANFYRSFLQKYGGHPEAGSARYGLALCLLQQPGRDYGKAVEELNHIAGSTKMPEFPLVQYYSGLARRGLALDALALARARPGEAAHHNNVAQQRLAEAAKNFDTAAKLFLERGKGATAEKGLPPDLEWAARARCDQAEMLLRLGKAKEAREALGLFTGAEQKKWLNSRYANLALYQAGFANFLAGDITAAGRLLSRTAVQEGEGFGTHARYLLGRIHHTNKKRNERAEARTQYAAVLKGHEEEKKAATEKLRQPLDADTRARLDRLVKGPPPDHVSRAGFYLGVLQYEDGNFAEALAHFQKFDKESPEASLLPESKLRQGFCQVQLKQFDEALKTLQPIADKQPALADQALYWMARAQAGKVDPSRGGKYDVALDLFRRAAQKAQERTGADPGAKARRGEVLCEYARTLHAAGQHREAANTLQGVLNDKLLPGREDETTLDLAMALQLAGDYPASEKACEQFLAKYKDSPLMPALLFRQAENSTFQAQAARSETDPAKRKARLEKHLGDAVKRYEELIKKYPESAHVNYARQGLGSAYYIKGDLDKALKVLEAVPASERTGELAGVWFQVADVLLRQTPARADDAIAAGKLGEKLKGAAEALDGFLSAAPASPQAPDALLKMGYVLQRQAGLLAKREEKNKALNEARGVYDRLLKGYPASPAVPQAVLERAKAVAQMGDHGTAMNELRRFQSDPLKKSPTAPMAYLALANLQRAQKKPADAATTLAACRKDFEGALGGDPARKWWVGLIQYHHATALREAGKLDEARALFDQVTRSVQDRPEGWDAALRAGQCQAEQGSKRIADGRKALAGAGKPQHHAAAEKLISDGVNDLRSAVGYLAGQASDLAKRKVAGEEAKKVLEGTRSRLLYEAAWGWRALADFEVEAARQKLYLDRLEKRRADLTKGRPAGSPPPQVSVPRVRLVEVPAQPAEASAVKAYEDLIKAFPDRDINADARFELAELLATRGKYAEAVKMLQAVLEGDREPSPELTDKVKLRLGACLLDQGTRQVAAAQKRLALGAKPDQKAGLEKQVAAGKKLIESAMEHLQTVTSNEKSKVLAHAVYREGECLLQLGKTDEAIKLLTRFRDLGPYQNLPGLSDRALLRLGAAFLEKAQWDNARGAYQAVIDRTGGTSPWVPEARYGIAWTFQSQGRYDEAVNAYNQVTAAVTTELAARAQLNVGLCRLAQKRPAEAATELLVVPFTYDYPEVSALALLEAARALHEDKKTARAVNLLRRVIRDYPDSPHAAAARKRLTDMGES